jgi:pyruvyltransferase
MISCIAKGIKLVLRKLRTEPKNRMFWVGREKECPNFGDLIGPYLYQKIAGTEPEFCETSNYSLKSVHLSVGSLLFWCKENCVVWGSGIIYKGQCFPKPLKVLAVRGPITREHFLQQGYSCPEIYGDPALLLPLYYQPKPLADRYRFGIVPHYVDKSICNELFKDSPDVLIIDVFDSVEVVIDKINSCDQILSSSLHGIIIAHAYGIQAGWIKFGEKIWGDDIKYQDHYASLFRDQLTVQACLIAAPLDSSEMAEIVQSYPQPTQKQIEKRQKHLIDSCPF